MTPHTKKLRELAEHARQHFGLAWLAGEIEQATLNLEIAMGQTADAIKKLEDAYTAKVADLTAQLAAEQAKPKLDDADTAAIAGVDPFLNPAPPAPADTVPAST